MDLFVYGTLRHRPLFDLVAGPGDGGARAVPALMPGHVVRRAAGTDLPVPVPVPVPVPGEGAAEGVLWSGLTPGQRARLARYQVPFGYWPDSVEVLAAAAMTPATVYRPPAGIRATAEPWTLAHWLATGAPLAMLAARELAATDPWPDGPTLAWQWPMITARAAAVLRAGQAGAPATLRHAAVPGDTVWHHARPLQGRFFRLASLSLCHRRLDGAMSDALLREVLIGADAALVLPYDPGRDRVLLVEQMRPAPLLRGDPNPWMLEPVAGIVDAGETPEAAARRECLEEAGLTPRALLPMFATYASPGSTTDHFHCYLGLCDLPDDHPTRGGLADEGEDLRLHLVPFDAAMALLDSGEANAGPLVAMLLWLARHRGRPDIVGA